MFNKKSVIILLVVAMGFGVGLLFKDRVLDMANNAAKTLQDIKQSDLGQAVQEIGKDILTPPPLDIGGNANNATLTASRVIIETNLQRKNNGNLPALIENAKLNAAAKAKAEDMFAKQYFEHVSPDGTDPGELVKAYGYEYITTGENLILGNFTDEKEVVQLWMDSPGHRANIVNNRYTQIGVAMVKGKYKGKTAWIGVQEFGLPLESCHQIDENLKAQIQTNKNIMQTLETNIETKRAEIETTSKRSEKYNQLVDDYNVLVAKYNILSDQTKTLVSKYNAEVNEFNNCVSGK